MRPRSCDMDDRRASSGRVRCVCDRWQPPPWCAGRRGSVDWLIGASGKTLASGTGIAIQLGRVLGRSTVSAWRRAWTCPLYPLTYFARALCDHKAPGEIKPVNFHSAARSVKRPRARQAMAHVATPEVVAPTPAEDDAAAPAIIAPPEDDASNKPKRPRIEARGGAVPERRAGLGPERLTT